MRVLRDLLLAVVLLLSPFHPFCQNEMDVLRYSRSELHGTARYVGMAGAFGSLGADLSSINSNPAGAALLRKNELAFTPSFTEQQSRSFFKGERKRREQLELAVEQIGGVIFRPSQDPNWKSFHIGISYDRLRSFNEKVQIKGQDPARSILDRFVRISNGIHLSELNQKAPFTGEIAYQSFLMDPKGDSTSYSHRLEGAEHDVNRRIERGGSMGEARVTLAFDRVGDLYIGGKLGMPVINFDQRTLHKEDVKGGSDVQDFSYEEALKIRGSGLNLGFGAIYRPDSDWRFGLSARSPSILYLSEEWDVQMKADFGSGRTEKENPDAATYEYRILTPYRLVASAAYFIQKSGLLSIEYQFRNHRSGKLFSPQGAQNGAGYVQENRAIRDRFRAGHELRAGLEWRLSPLYLRGGYRFLSPVQRKWGKLREKASHTYTMGLGYRKKGFFLDVSYRKSLRSQLHRPTDPVSGRTARILKRRSGFLLTGGTRF